MSRALTFSLVTLLGATGCLLPAAPDDAPPAPAEVADTDDTDTRQKTKAAVEEAADAAPSPEGDKALAELERHVGAEKLYGTDANAKKLAKAAAFECNESLVDVDGDRTVNVAVSVTGRNPRQVVVLVQSPLLAQLESDELSDLSEDVRDGIDEHADDLGDSYALLIGFRSSKGYLSVAHAREDAELRSKKGAAGRTLLAAALAQGIKTQPVAVDGVFPCEEDATSISGVGKCRARVEEGETSVLWRVEADGTYQISATSSGKPKLVAPMVSLADEEGNDIGHATGKGSAKLKKKLKKGLYIVSLFDEETDAAEAIVAVAQQGGKR